MSNPLPPNFRKPDAYKNVSSSQTREYVASVDYDVEKIKEKLDNIKLDNQNGHNNGTCITF